MAEKIEVQIKAVDKASKDLKKLSKNLKGVERQAKKTDKPLARLKKNLGGLKSQLIPAAAIVGSFGFALKKAFDLAEQGAVVQQTRESFDRLMDSVGAAPNILQQLRQASQGTVDDLTLMSSTQTLLAGTTDVTSKALADSLPELLNIAKAAQKLNPELGDTAFLFKSIATGIKRASPLILDNLGLTIKVGEANEAYAKQLGITVDELSAQDKQIALLNATLEAGNIILGQVGGTTESAQDSFRRFTATTKNLSDELAVKLLPSVSGVVETLNLLLTASRNIDQALDDQHANVIKNAEGYDEYSTEMERAAKAAGTLAITQEELERRSELLGRDLSKTVDFLIILSDTEFEATRTTEILAEAQDDLAESARNLVQEQEEVNRILGDLHTLMSINLTRDFETLKDRTGDLEKKSMDLREEIGELEGSWKKNTDEGKKELEKLREELGDTEERIDDLAEAWDRQTKQLIFRLAEQRLAIEGFTTEELDALARLAGPEGLGLVDQAGQDLLLTINANADMMAQAGDQSGIFVGKLKRLQKEGLDPDTASAKALANQLARIKSKTVTITTKFRNIAPPRRFRQEGRFGFEHGGQFRIPGSPSQPVPVSFIGHGRETVTVTPAGQSAPSTAMGGGFTFVYSPAISLGDEAEARDVIGPLIAEVVRDELAVSAN